ncbi:MAG: hypothetical protein AAGH76_00810 [Pseudomonadota bacterium]
MGKYIDQCRARDAANRRFEQEVDAVCRRQGHGLQHSRRGFLNAGLIGGLGTVFLPSLATVLSREAHAQAACADNAPLLGRIPYLAFDMGGGANIAGSNIMVGGMGGQEDFLTADGYAKLGLPEAIIPQNVGVDRTFGLAFHPNSAMLRGLLDKTSAGTRTNVNGIVIPARSENDTGNNPHNPIYGIARAGANGQFVATIGSRNSESGGKSRAPDSMIQADLRPTKVSNRNEALGLAGGNVDDGFPNGRVSQAASVISALKLGQIDEEQATKELVQCGFDKSAATFNTVIGADDLDPEADPVLQNLFPNGQLEDRDYRKAAAAMKVVLNGYGGAGTVEYGGRDYHQDPRPETDNKDFIIGQVMGASLEYAAQLGQPLMIYLFSDGSVSADTNREEDDGNGTTKFRWRSDNSQTAASAMLVYSPNGRPALRDPAAQQLGFFRPDGNIETASTPFANSVGTLAEMVVLNYLGLHGLEGMFGSVLNNPGLGTGAAVAPYIAFEPIA